MSRRIFVFLAGILTALAVTVAADPAATAAPAAVFVLPPGSHSYFDTDVVSLGMVAVGGTAPYSWSGTGFGSSRLAINPSTGIISNTGGLLTPGSYTVTVTAVDSFGGSGSTTFGIRIVRECRTC